MDISEARRWLHDTVSDAPDVEDVDAALGVLALLDELAPSPEQRVAQAAVRTGMAVPEVPSGTCGEVCSHGGFCSSPAGHGGRHDASGFCRWAS